MHGLGPWVRQFFSANNSLLSYFLLSCFLLLNVTSPPLLFWMSDQKNHPSKSDDCFTLGWLPACAGDPVQLELPLHFLVALPSLTYTPFRSGWEAGLGNGE